MPKESRPQHSVGNILPQKLVRELGESRAMFDQGLEATGFEDGIASEQIEGTLGSEGLFGISKVYCALFIIKTSTARERTLGKVAPRKGPGGQSV